MSPNFTFARSRFLAYKLKITAIRLKYWQKQQSTLRHEIIGGELANKHVNMSLIIYNM